MTVPQPLIDTAPPTATHGTAARVTDTGGTPPSPGAATDPWDRPRSHGVHLRLVRTPGPPLESRPVDRLTVPGVRSPRPAAAPGPRPALDRPDHDDFGPTATRRGDLPDPAVTARMLVTTTLEAFAGRRSFSQLQSAYTLPVFTRVSRGRRPRWCTEGTGPLLVTSVRVAEPVDGVAEVSAVARRNGRAHAVAARLEGIDGQWRCTALQVG